MGFERLAAGVIVIGLIVWGASILATPDELPPPPGADPLPDEPEEAPAAQPAEEPDEGGSLEGSAPAGSEPEGRGKGKKGRGD